MSKPAAAALLLALAPRFAGKLSGDAILAYEMACGAADILTRGLSVPLAVDVQNAVAAVFAMLVPPRLLRIQPLLDERRSETGLWEFPRERFSCWVDERGWLVLEREGAERVGLNLLGTSAIVWVRSVMRHVRPRDSERVEADVFWDRADLAATRFHSAGHGVQDAGLALLAPVKALAASGAVYCERHSLRFGQLFSTEPGGLRDHRVTMQILGPAGSIAGHLVFYVSDTGLLPGGRPLAHLEAWIRERHAHCK